MLIFPISKRVMNKLMEGEGADGGPAVAAPPAPKRIKLCEGLDGYDVPIETAYVKQGKKVWVAWDDQKGAATSLQESLDEGMQLVESIEALELLEDASGSSYVKDGLWIVEGPSQRSGVKNANKRTYGRKIWERIIADPNSPQQKAIKARAMIGHLEHPKDGRTDGNLGALVVIESTLREDGVVWNKYELLDTPAGKILQEYTKKKVRWGVSSRGNGTVDDDGNVNESDFVLETWDAVMRPSTPGAFPELVGATGAKGKKKGVNEDAKIPAGDEPAGGMTEEVKACLQHVGLQVETKTAELSRSDSATLMVGLIESATKLTGYAANGGVPAEQARTLATRLETVMKAVAANLQKTAEQSVTEAIEAASGVADKQGGAFARVIEGLRTRISEAVSEASAKQTRVEELEASLAEAERKLAESDKALDITKRKLDVATAALSETSERAVKAGVAEAVDELVESFPGLAGYRSELLESDSALDVVARAAGLLSHGTVTPTVAAPRLSESVDPANRTTLPQGLVESGPVRITRVEESAPLPAGARMAASVVSRMPAAR
jgi:hypothetical protein